MEISKVAKKFLKKYYPNHANKFAGLPMTKRNWIRALKHSIRKWEGIKAIMKGKYKGLDIWSPAVAVIDSEYNDILTISTTTCTLCVLSNLCCSSKCILGNKCNMLNLKGISPWQHFTQGNDPKPMLNMLKKALKKLEGK